MTRSDAADASDGPSSGPARGRSRGLSARPPAGRDAPLRDVQTLRPGSSVAVGVAGGLAGLGLLVPGLVSTPRSWPILSTVVLGMVLLWLFVVRPCAKLHAEGIRLVNPLRIADLTWSAIDEVRSKWALELFSRGRKFTAWGVPADPGRPRHGRGMFAIGANQVPGQDRTTQRRAKVEAQTVAAEVEARIEADRRRKDGRTPRVAEQAWDPAAVGLLLAALAFFVVAVVLG